MALNFSQRPIFSAHSPDDNLVSPMRFGKEYIVEGVPDLNNDGFAKQWHPNRDMEDRGGSQDSVTADILDLLPSDPFGMDISSSFTAITRIFILNNALRFRELSGSIGFDKSNSVSGFGENCDWMLDDESSQGARFRELSGSIGFDKSNSVSGFGKNCDWMLVDESSQGARFCESSGSIGFDKSNSVSGFSENCDEMRDDESSQNAFISTSSVDDILCFGYDKSDNFLKENDGMCTDGDVGAPHPALNYAIGCLGTKDLLMVSKVCKSLHSTVHSDMLLWKHIHVDQPLKEKISDDNLLELTNMAQGALQCLSLIECPKVTDDGLKRVLESNPKLTKLSVAGCTRISIDGIVSIVKASKSTGIGVKHLRIGGLFGITHGHFEELKVLLGTDKCNQKVVRKPHLYKRGNLYLSCDEDCAIDVEICPRCQNVRLVYDCPAADCNGNKCSMLPCRACTLCIRRCMQCGQCINGEYEETFCLGFLCSDCCKRVPKCQDRTISPSTDDPSMMDVHG